MKKWRILSLLIVTAAVAGIAQADLITGVSATGPAFDYSWAPWSCLPQNAVDSTGLSTVGGVLVHSNLDAAAPVHLQNDAWVSTWAQWDAAGNSPADPRGVSAHWMCDGGDGTAITVDLGDTYDVGSFHLWNFNMTGVTGRGMKEAEIYTSVNGTDWTQQGGTWTFAQAPDSAAYAGEEFTLEDSWDGVRYVKIVNKLTWDNNGGKVGLSEIQFFTTVPEPATMSLLVIGGGLALLRKRK